MCDDSTEPRDNGPTDDVETAWWKQCHLLIKQGEELRADELEGGQPLSVRMLKMLHEIKQGLWVC